VEKKELLSPAGSRKGKVLEEKTKEERRITKKKKPEEQGEKREKTIPQGEKSNARPGRGLRQTRKVERGKFMKRKRTMKWSLVKVEGSRGGGAPEIGQSLKRGESVWKRKKKSA